MGRTDCVISIDLGFPARKSHELNPLVFVLFFIFSFLIYA